MAGLVRGHKGLVYPTNFAVSSDTATVQIGYPYQIPYTITPTNATNQIIKWTSSNDNIATVDSKGIITAVSTGTCTVTGVYSYDGTTVTIAVTTTEVHTTGITLDKDSLLLDEGDSIFLHATVAPSNTSYPGYTWSTSDANIASVTNTGLVKYIGEGTCTITATTVDGGFTATCSVVCVTHVTGVSLDTHSITLDPGDTQQLTAIVSPSTATYPSVTWSSSNASVATVSSTGLVTYVGIGTCTITVTTTDGGYSDVCEVACGILVTGVSLNYSSGEVQASSPLQLVATITPSDATNKDVIWSSSNTSVAAVDGNGLVTYVGDGNATITCTTVDGGYTATCGVTCVSFVPVDTLFGYTGAQQSISLEPHTYCIEVWGASGGTFGSAAGKGGYAAGCITLTNTTCLYVYVGGCGLVCSAYNACSPGGWNGGGNGWAYNERVSPGGGGGTDVRIGGNTLYHRRIVAGGGGGGGCYSSCTAMCGGAGGGTNGCQGGAYSSRPGGNGGTQTSGGSNSKPCYMVAGSFGQGGYKTNYTSGYNGAGGGGGWYGGGAGSAVSAGGGGGSGYVYTSATCSSAPSGYCHCTAYYLTNACTCCGLVSFPSPSGGTETGHTGCGCVRIRSID